MSLIFDPAKAPIHRAENYCKMVFYLFFSELSASSSRWSILSIYCIAIGTGELVLGQETCFKLSTSKQCLSVSRLTGLEGVVSVLVLSVSYETSAYFFPCVFSSLCGWSGGGDSGDHESFVSRGV